MSREFLRRFQIMRPIATGAFGEVFLAKEVHADGFSRLVALKLLHHRWSDNKEVTQRLRDEARLLGWLRHRNILDVVDLTSIDGRTALIMEFIEGIDLGFLIGAFYANESLVPMRSGLQVAAFACSALDAAYNRPPYPGEKPLRVIHRDIKPSNIMIDESGAVKVLDFGVAQAEFDERESKTQDLQFGSVEYMPPERLFFEPDTPASDVYSLGVTLFELIAVGKFGKAQPRPSDHAGTVRDRLSYLRARRGISGPVADDFEALMIEMLSYEVADRPSASEATIRLREIARRFNDFGVAEWAPEYIPPLVAQFRDEGESAHPLTGTLLSEDTSVLRQGDDTPSFRPVTGGRPLPQDAPPPPTLAAPPLPPAPTPVAEHTDDVFVEVTEGLTGEYESAPPPSREEVRPTVIEPGIQEATSLSSLGGHRLDAPASVETRVLDSEEDSGEAFSASDIDEERPTDPGALEDVIANLHRSADERTLPAPVATGDFDALPELASPAAYAEGANAETIETRPPERPPSVETEPTPDAFTTEPTTMPGDGWDTGTHPGESEPETAPSRQKPTVETVPTPMRNRTSAWLPAAAVLLAPLTGTLLGFLWFQPAAQAVPAPAFEQSSTPAPEPEAAPEAPVETAVFDAPPAPDAAADLLRVEGAVPEGMIRFRAADRNTKKLIARCDGHSDKGSLAALVEAEGTSLCTVSAVFEDRTRQMAVVEMPEAGSYSCFSEGNATCEMDD